VIPIEWRRLHLATARALLAAERRALAGLRLLLDRFLRDHARVARGPHSIAALPAAARELEALLSADLLRARAGARRAASATLQSEFDLALEQGAARELPPLDIRPELVGIGENDNARARTAAASFTADWQAGAMDQVAARAPAPWRAAAARLASRVQLDATTETAHAFTSEREESTARFAARPETRAWAPLLVKIWDATLDRRRCLICSSMAGQIRPWGLSFSGGRIPGGVHPRCRCTPVSMLLPLTWREDVEYAEAA
jgi:hypothetical protein